MIVKPGSIDWKLKLQAFAVHFGISLVIFLVLLYFIFFEWYPLPFFSTDGGTQGLRLIIFVDLVLGPTLTFIVFNRNKPLLKFDLAVIGIIQLAALSYGVWAVHNEHPVALVFADDRFTPIPYYQFKEAGFKADDLNQFGNRRPVTIYVKLPDESDTEGRAAFFLNAYQTQTALFLMGDRYRQVDEDAAADIARHAIDMKSYLQEDYLKDRKEAMQQTYRDFLTGLPQPAGDYLYLPLFARYCKCILVAERATLDFVDVLKIPPPQITQTIIEINKTKPVIKSER